MYETAARGPLVERAAVVRGAAVGLALIIPITILGAVLDRTIDDFDDTGWRVLLAILILVAYGVSGWVAGRIAHAPWTNGALAGLGAFVLWIPVRILIWVLRDEHRGLFTGAEPVLKLGQIFGQLVLATALGMLGGFLAGRGGPESSVPTE
jgi:hypothetical protein